MWAASASGSLEARGWQEETALTAVSWTKQAALAQQLSSETQSINVSIFIHSYDPHFSLMNQNPARFKLVILGAVPAVQIGCTNKTWSSQGSIRGTHSGFASAHTTGLY
jgi:hypothetical protein